MWPYSWVIGCQKWPFCIFYGIFIENSHFQPHVAHEQGVVFDQTKWYSTQKKRLFQMAYFKFHEKNYWESSKLTNSKINPSTENHAHFISWKPPDKNHPRDFGPTLWFIQIATSVVEKSQILSVVFHLSTTVCAISYSSSFIIKESETGGKLQQLLSKMSCTVHKISRRAED